MSNTPAMPMTTGDARRLILETMMGLRDGSIPTDRGMAMAANMKVLNESLLTEIAAAKVTILAQERGVAVGALVPVGQWQLT